LQAAVGDLNGDGKLDLILTRWNSSPIVHLGNGDGTFQAGQSINSTYGSTGADLVLGDLDGDGYLDVAWVNYNGVQDAVEVQFGDGTGAFGNAINLAPTSLNELKLVDFNGDGHLDIISTPYNDNPVVYLGNGNRTFQGAASIGSVALKKPNPGGVDIGDFNGDGHADIVIGDTYNGNAAVILGDGVNSNLGISTIYGDRVVVADLDGDGYYDVISEYYAAVRLSGGNGDGTFKSEVAIADLGSGSFASLAVGDFNRDGKLDVVGGMSGKIVIFTAQ